MFYLLAIDPSLRSSGVASFVSDQTFHAYNFVSPKKFKGLDALFWQMEILQRYIASFVSATVLGEKVDFRIVVEEQVDRGDNERMTEESFRYFSALPYAIIPPNLYDKVVFVKPVQWKKQIPKEIHHKRIYDKEVKKGTHDMFIKDMQPDVMDAIGLGRWYLERNKSEPK